MSKRSKHNTTVKETSFYTSYLKTKLMIQLTKGIALFVLFLLMGTTTVFAQPINDDCAGAITLPLMSVREYTAYTNELASDSSNVSTPSCGQYQGADVWFKLTLPENKIIIDLVTTSATSNVKVVLSLYKNTCNNLEEIKCSESGTPSDFTISSRVKFNPQGNSDALQPGDEIYIRVFRFGSTVGGTFDIGAYLQGEEAIPLNDICSQATELTTEKGSFDFQSFSTENASETNGLALPSACLDCDVNDVWFKAKIPSSGKLIIETNPGTITPAVVVYKGDCANLVEYAFSKEGSIDNGGEIFIDNSAMVGQTIYIRAISSQTEGGTFKIAIVEPKQDVCEDAIELADADLVEKYIGYTNQYASINGTEPTCGIFEGKDIWFLIRVPSNGKLLIDTKLDETYEVKPVLTVYTGSCGNLNQYACDFFGSSTNPFGAKIDIDDSALANQFIYLRMYAYNDAVGGRFEMSTMQSAALPVDLVAFKSEVINNETVDLEWQTASELNNDYFIVEHSTDGKEFTPVIHVQGKGTTSDRQTYNFVHDEPFFGENYYRLKQVDFDGQYEYSKIVTAIIKMEETKVNVYPNPALVTEGISIRWNGDFGKEKVQLSITNSIGKQILKQSIDVKNQRQVDIDFSRLSLEAGHYYLTISDKNALITHQKLNILKD